MEIQNMQTIWVAEKQDISASSTLFATYSFEDIFNILCEEKYITEKTLVDDDNLDVCSVLKAYGKSWKKVLMSFSAKKLNRILYTDIVIRQIEIKKVIKEKNDES